MSVCVCLSVSLSHTARAGEWGWGWWKNISGRIPENRHIFRFRLKVISSHRKDCVSILSNNNMYLNEPSRMDAHIIIVGISRCGFHFHLSGATPSEVQGPKIA